MVVLHKVKQAAHTKYRHNQQCNKSAPVKELIKTGFLPYLSDQEPRNRQIREPIIEFKKSELIFMIAACGCTSFSMRVRLWLRIPDPNKAHSVWL